MKRIAAAFTLCALITGAVFAQAPNTLTAKEKREGWKLLFDGKTTSGWHTYLKDTVGAKWQVKDGALAFDPAMPRGGGDIVTNEEFENYEFSVEWKIAEGGNSGIIFNVNEALKLGQTYLTGPEMQVLDNIKASDNKVPTHLAGLLYDMAGTADMSKPKPIGEWNEARIQQKNGHLTLWFNGIKTYEGQIGSPEWNTMVAGSKFRNREFVNFGKYTKGKIAFQDHGGVVAFRNIKIRPL